MLKIHGSDSQKQTTLIQQVNRVAEPIKGIENGMCYMLSLNWIVRCLSHCPIDIRDPVKEFNLMTSSANIWELRQVAHNFRSFRSDVLEFNYAQNAVFSPEWVRKRCTEAQTLAEMLSRKKCTAVPYLLEAKLAPMTPKLRNLTIQPGTEAYLILFHYEDANKRMCGHAVAMVSANDGSKDKYFTYDPNLGVIESATIKTLTKLLKKYVTKSEDKARIYIIKVQPI